MSKWLKDSEAAQPLSEVARQALADRFQQVWKFAQLSAESVESSTENVHQLRVWSRRCVSAIRLFRDQLPRRRARRCRKRLQRIRRAAGRARDLDVLLARLPGLCERIPPAALSQLMKTVVLQRAASQQSILEMQDDVEQRRFARSSARLVAAVRWRGPLPELTLGEAAGGLASSVCADFFQAGIPPLNKIEQLHRLRIRGKHFRYVMEILAGAFSADWRRVVYPAIGDLQERLGRLNDRAAAMRQYRELIKTEPVENVQRTLRRLIDEENAAIGVDLSSFVDDWVATDCRRLESMFQPFGIIARSR